MTMLGKTNLQKMKKSIIILAGMLSAFWAQATNDIVYHWKGDLPDDAGMIEITAARRTSDNLLIGQFYWEGCPYDIAGWEDPADPDRIGFIILRDGYSEGSVMARIDSKGNLDGRLKMGSFSTKMYIGASEIFKEYPDQFVTQTINDMSRFTFYSATETIVLDEGEESPRTSIVLEKDSDKFAFKCVGGRAGGLGSLDVLDDGTAIRESYDYDSVYFTYDNAPHYLEFEVFLNLLVVRYTNEDGTDEPNKYSMADGIYSLKGSSDEFDSIYFDPRFFAFYADGDGENDDESDYVVGDAAWGVRREYQDVLELSLLINTSRILKEKFPVEIGQASKPNIDMYFHALADAFKDYDGLFKNALPLARPDLKNGYLDVSVPGKLGGEGIGMCFWRGAEGKDVIALKMRYDEFDVNEEYEDRPGWMLVFFHYNPSDKALTYITRWTYRSSDVSIDAKYYCPDDLLDVDDVKLPQVGKTIQFVDGLGRTVSSCTWDADIQWFKWDK